MIYDKRDCARLRNGVLLVSALAWVAMAAAPDTACHGAAGARGMHDYGFSAGVSVSAMADAWLVMLVAMMLPLTLPPLYHVRISSFVKRRWRSSTLFLMGYGAVWMAVGVVLQTMVVSASRMAPQSYGPAAIVGILAFVWQASPLKQRCLNRCRSHRALAAFGVAADLDALRMGFDHGFWCAGSCWAAMLVPMLLPEGRVAAMAAVTILMVSERLDPPRAPRWRLRGFQTVLRALRLRLFGGRNTAHPDAVTSAIYTSAG